MIKNSTLKSSLETTYRWSSSYCYSCIKSNSKAAQNKIKIDLDFWSIYCMHSSGMCAFRILIITTYIYIYTRVPLILCISLNSVTIVHLIGTIGTVFHYLHWPRSRTYECTYIIYTTHWSENLSVSREMWLLSPLIYR